MPQKLSTKKHQVRKPRTSGKPGVAGPKQKPVKTPMSVGDRKARANKAKAMSRRGGKGPVQYK